MQNLSELEPVLNGKAEEVRRALIVSAPQMKAGTIRRCIKVFNLESAFRNVGKITAYVSDKGYGFITDLSTSESLFFRKAAVIRIRPHSEPEPGHIVYFGNVRKGPDPARARAATTVLMDLDAIDHEGLDNLAGQGQLSILLTVAQFIQHIDFTPYLDTAVEQQLRNKNLAVVVQYSKSIHTIIQSKSETIRSVMARLSPTMSLRDVETYIKKLGLQDKFANCARVSAYFPEKHYGFLTDIQTGEDFFFHDSSVKGPETKVLLQVGRIVHYDTIGKNPEHRRPRAMGLTAL